MTRLCETEYTSWYALHKRYHTNGIVGYLHP